MKKLFLILTAFLSITALSACGQRAEKTSKHKVDSKAHQLNDSAISLTMKSQDSLTYVKAISLLNQATAIDSDYYFAYWNKLAFQSQLEQYDKALLTTKQLLRLKPNAPDYYLSIGMLYEKTGDTTSANKYFHTGLSLYNNLLDTMSTKNKSYNILLMNKSLNLILVGQEKKGNEILKQLYDRQIDETFKEFYSSFMNKSRKEIIDNYINRKPSYSMKIKLTDNH